MTDPAQFEPALLYPGRVLVVGLGASGRAALELCRQGGREVFAYDQKPWTGPQIEGVQFFSGPQIPDAAFAGVQNVVMSPGIDPRPVRAQLESLGVQVQLQGEMGLALATAQALWPQVSSVLVTGTNGKSTVTHLCAHLLRAQFSEVFAGGNLGIPLSEMVVNVLTGQAPRPEVWVLECSSYQLETLCKVRAQVAMLLNVSPDHLDRYRDIEHYARTKASIFDALGPADLALLDAQDPRSAILSPTRGNVVRVGDEQGPGWRAHAEGQGELFLGPGASMNRELLRLPGAHNAKNAVFALLAARHLGVSVEQAQGALASYQGLEHRMQWVAEIDGVSYYNDSKATNVASVRAGLAGFPRDFVLICGGRAKQGDDPNDLLEVLRDRCQGLIGIGESGKSFVEVARKAQIPTQYIEELSAAVQQAKRLASPGQAVVLSPACASWDQFSSFAQRGQVFVDALQASLLEI